MKILDYFSLAYRTDEMDYHFELTSEKMLEAYELTLEFIKNCGIFQPTIFMATLIPMRLRNNE